MTYVYEKLVNHLPHIPIDDLTGCIKSPDCKSGRHEQFVDFFWKIY